MLKERFLDKSNCYICGEDIYNYELNELFDGRVVKLCFQCYAGHEIDLAVYYCNLAGIDMQWD